MVAFKTPGNFLHALARKFQDERRQSPNLVPTERIVPNAEAY